MASATAPTAKAAPPTFEPQPSWSLLYQGAEARIWKIPDYLHPHLAAIAKERFVKTYRHAVLDAKLTKSRCKAEAKSLLRARRGGVACPAVWGVQIPILYLEFLDGPTVRQYLEEAAAASTTKPNDGPSKVASEMGTLIGKLHNTGTIHGDLTTSNMIMASKLEMRMHLIDFGLARVSQNPEEMAVDLYVLERAVISTHPELEETDFMDLVLQAYKATCSKSDAVLQRLSSVRMRGRKRECFG
jgi:TP53 regulating kinase-like protein